MASFYGYEQFAGHWGENARLALDTIEMKPARGIPSWTCHPMDAPFIEEMIGRAPGDFRSDPDGVYIAFQQAIGTCYIDQYLAENVLSMSHGGFESDTPRSATTGAQRIVRDGIEIDSPEAVVEHMERCVFPARKREIESFNSNDPALVAALVDGECALQKKLGHNILKGPYGGFFSFPCFQYYAYGYANYFMTYALYPEVIERDFAQQADLAALRNRAAARAIIDGGLPRLLRLDHDMADARGTLASTASLEKIWLPHFARAIRPLLDSAIRLIWHCDGNLMGLVPGLLEAGVGGFQGFQYEHGMDYERICRMNDRDGRPLLIIAGVSVTTTLPYGTREDVIAQMRRLVEHGPRRGLFLGASSSITPNTNRENIRTFIEGLEYYRHHKRD